jgi:hypothetical protein
VSTLKNLAVWIRICINPPNLSNPERMVSAPSQDQVFATELKAIKNHEKN